MNLDDFLRRGLAAQRAVDEVLSREHQDTPADDLTREACAIHEALMAWLRATAPQAHPLAVVTACSYEIGRLVGQLSDRLSPAETEDLVERVAATMRAHLVAYRRGLTR